MPRSDATEDLAQAVSTSAELPVGDEDQVDKQIVDPTDEKPHRGKE
ncbi:hypothetical protein [Sphingomonas sp. NFX23]